MKLDTNCTGCGFVITELSCCYKRNASWAYC